MDCVPALWGYCKMEPAWVPALQATTTWMECASYATLIVWNAWEAAITAWVAWAGGDWARVSAWLRRVACMGSILWMANAKIYARIIRIFWKECVSTKSASKDITPTPTAAASAPPSTNANKATTTTKAIASSLVLSPYMLTSSASNV